MTAALLMVVLVGFAAISVDAGAIWLDRQEAQNGADAAALALAQTCAAGSCEDDSQDIAEANKRDAQISRVIVDLHETDGWVSVTVVTDRQHWFAPVFGPESATTEVSQVAYAAWGKIRKAVVLPLAVSECAIDPWPIGTMVRFDEFMEPPPGSTKQEAPAKDCPEYTPGVNIIPGGFGWLNPTDLSTCSVETSIDGGAPSRPGGPGPVGGSFDSCDTLLSALQDQNDGVLVPIYDYADRGGKNGIYTIIAYAHLEVTSYCLSSTSEQSRPWRYPLGVKCNPNGFYLEGRLLERVELGDADLGTTGSPGSSAVKLISGPPVP